MIFIFICAYYISSPYLLVFGDDRVRGTHEQRILQQELVRLRAEVGLVGNKRCICNF